MELTDSHSHLFLPQFKDDLDQVVNNALLRKVKHIFLPNIDASSIEDMHALCRDYPETFYPMMGLHPCSVGNDFEEQLKVIEKHLTDYQYTAVGETGLDLYHDETKAEEQLESFKRHIRWAKNFSLPLVLHSRNCNEEVYKVVKEEGNGEVSGVFHCFNGDQEFAQRVMELGFYIGIGGVVTFKNSKKLPEVVKNIPLEYLLLETDAPYLAPHPYRGKRNESAYIYEIASKIALIKEKPIEEVAEKTTQNAFNLFKNPEKPLTVK